MKKALLRGMWWICEPVTTPPPRLLVVLFGAIFIFDRDLYALANTGVVAALAVGATPLILIRLTYVWIRHREGKGDD